MIRISSSEMMLKHGLMVSLGKSMMHASNHVRDMGGQNAHWLMGQTDARSGMWKYEIPHSAE